MRMFVIGQNHQNEQWQGFLCYYEELPGNELSSFFVLIVSNG